MILLMLYVILAIHLLTIGFLAMAFFKKGKIETNKDQHTFSIVVAAKDEVENLKKLIPSLLSQQYSNFEIIIALDRCKDDSLKYVKSLNSTRLSFLSIENIPLIWNAKKFALNEAVKKAKGEFLVFTDADCQVVSTSWLKTINDQVNEKVDIVIGVSPYEHSNSFLSKYIQFEAFMTAFLCTSLGLLGKPYMAVGRNLTIRKAFFTQQGGYAKIKGVHGGDDDLFIQQNANATNTSIMIGTNSLVYTYPKKTWKAYFNQKLRHFSVGHTYKISDQIILSVIHSSHLSLFIAIPLFIYFDNLLWIFLLYLFIKLVSYRFAASKMGISINYMMLPLVDMLYAVLTPLISLWSKLEKDIKWKN